MPGLDEESDVSSTSIIDNQGENTLAVGIENITGWVKELCIATAFFSLGALVPLGKELVALSETIRIMTEIAIAIEAQGG
jgi:hypothetical protein